MVSPHARARRELLHRLLEQYERSRAFGRTEPWARDLILRLDARHFPEAFHPDGRETLAALRTAAAEVDIAAAREADRRVRARLEALAAEMRARAPDPPEGFDAETHRLLLARLDDVEKWSLDDVESRLPR